MTDSWSLLVFGQMCMGGNSIYLDFASRSQLRTLWLWTVSPEQGGPRQGGCDFTPICWLVVDSRIKKKTLDAFQQLVGGLGIC